MAESNPKNFVALVMAGGSGTRFWPLSQPDRPKQYLTLVGNRSLIQATIDRLQKQVPLSNIFICSGENQKKLIQEQLPKISGLILEPKGKNTAPCLMLSVAHLLHQGVPPSTVMGVFPADHTISNETRFLSTLQYAIDEASSTKCLLTFGIKPQSAHTGYGYIEAGDKSGDHSFRVKRFVEKPTFEKAQEYVRQGTFYWNAGIFVWRLDAITEAFQTFLPQEWERVQAAIKAQNIHEIYDQLTSQPIDVAVMEKASNVRVIPTDMGWNDLGSWSALLTHLQQNDNSDNVVVSKRPEHCSFIDSHNNLICTSTSKKVVAIGIENLIIVETDKELLITHRSQDQRVKEIK